MLLWQNIQLCTIFLRKEMIKGYMEDYISGGMGEEPPSWVLGSGISKLLVFVESCPLRRGYIDMPLLLVYSFFFIKKNLNKCMSSMYFFLFLHAFCIRKTKPFPPDTLFLIGSEQIYNLMTIFQLSILFTKMKYG